MGEQHHEPFQLSFNSSLRVDVQGSRVTSDGGLTLVRELEARVGMGALIAQQLTDTRRGRHTQFPLAAKLRPGHVHRAEDWDARLLPELARQQQRGKDVVVRADAAFAKPEIDEALEARGVTSALRLPAHNSLEREIAELLTRPVGRPSQKPVVSYQSFRDQAASWDKARRVVAKVEPHRGALFPRVGCIVTRVSLPSRAAVRFDNRRGTAEQWSKAGQQATHGTRLSCHRFRAKAVRRPLSVLADNRGHLWRRLVLPKRIDHWSLTSVQPRLVKTGGRVVKHARYDWLLLAEGHLTRHLFGAMARRIAALPVPAG
jgi:hypothetical protein